MTAYKRKILENGARADGGFTLMEILIVVALVGIMAGIAYPSYQSYALAAKRGDAQATLLRISTLQEKFFSHNSAYATSTATLGYAAHPAVSNEGYWAVTISGVTASAFLLTAAPAGKHADADCGGITLSSAGLRGPADCW